MAARECDLVRPSGSAQLDAAVDESGEGLDATEDRLEVHRAVGLA